MKRPAVLLPGPGPLYVYAILPGEVSLFPGIVGLAGTPLTAVSWGALAAATSPIASVELRPTPENLLRHEAVVEQLRRTTRALPVRFGTTFENSTRVQQVLAQRHDTLLADLARIGDKVEMGLTVLWDPDGEEVAEGADQPAEGVGPGTSYLQARLAQHRREESRRSQARVLAREVAAILRGHASASQTRCLPTPRLALSAAYLVTPARLGAFGEAFEEVRRTHSDLRFLLSGPWPPYSFVTPPDRAGAASLPVNIQSGTGERCC